jgi:HEPN domain-containing protein
MNPKDAKVWMNYAETDLHAAYALLSSRDSFLRQTCFWGQQCVEKAIKAILVFEGLDFPRTYDLDSLRDFVPEDWEMKKHFPDLSGLTIWAVESRYPGDMPNVVEHEARETLRLAEAVFDTVSTELNRRIQQAER